MHTLTISVLEATGFTLEDSKKIKACTDVLLIPLGESTPDYINYILKEIPNWIGSNRISVLDAGRFFTDNTWNISTITISHASPLLILQVNKFDDKELYKIVQRAGDTDISSYPALNLSYHDVYIIVHRFSNYYYQAGTLVTDFCNLKCKMCMFHSDDHDDYKFALYRRTDRNRQDIEQNLLFDFIDQVPEKTGILFSSSGELLVKSHAADYIEYAAGKKLKTMVLTNGTLLTPEVSRRLLKTGVTQVIISIDGYTKESYEKKRTGACFSTVVNNVVTLKKIRDELKSTTVINVNTVLFPELEEKKDEIVSFWRGKADQLSLMAERIDQYGRPRKHLIPVPPDRLCFELMAGPLLLTNGLISPCCGIAIAEWFEPFPWLLTVTKTNLSEAIRIYRDMMLDENSPLREFCSKCHYWASSFWIKNRSPFSEIITLDSD